MFEKLAEKLEKSVVELKDLADSIKNSKDPMEGKLQPTTRLRKNVEEINKANENPELQKIKDRLSDILRGI